MSQSRTLSAGILERRALKAADRAARIERALHILRTDEDRSIREVAKTLRVDIKLLTRLKAWVLPRKPGGARVASPERKLRDSAIDWDATPPAGPGHYPQRSIRARFEERISPEPNTGCWLWIGSTTDGGYGRLSDGKAGRFFFAHRLSWLMHRGPIPDGLYVCHKCDQRGCCNPAHLFLGTPRDNVVDMVAKGRGRSGRRLTPEDVRHIRARARAGEAEQSIALHFGVKRQTVHEIAIGLRWATVGDAP